MATFAVILPAAGQSSRFHDKNYKKPYAPLANKAVWLHSAEKFVSRSATPTPETALRNNYAVMASLSFWLPKMP